MGYVSGMSHFGPPGTRVLYLVVCAAPGAEKTLERVASERAAGHDVCVIATERARDWFDVAAVESASGHIVQTRMRRFSEPIFEPLGGSLVVSPASLNTIAKIALGLADDMPTGLVCEALGSGVPVTIETQVGGPFGAHPALPGYLETLRTFGAKVHDLTN